MLAAGGRLDYKEKALGRSRKKFKDAPLLALEMGEGPGAKGCSSRS